MLPFNRNNFKSNFRENAMSGPEMGQFRFWNRNPPIFKLDGTGIGIESTRQNFMLESESELKRLDIILCWNQNRNWNLTTVSGIGIGIGIEGAGIVPSLV